MVIMIHEDILFRLPHLIYFFSFFFDLLFVHFDTNACPSVFINSSGLARPLLWEPSRLPKLMKSVLEQRPSPVLGVRPCALSRLANG